MCRVQQSFKEVASINKIEGFFFFFFWILLTEPNTSTLPRNLHSLFT